MVAGECGLALRVAESAVAVVHLGHDDSREVTGCPVRRLELGGIEGLSIRVALLWGPIRAVRRLPVERTRVALRNARLLEVHVAVDGKIGAVH